MSPAAIILATVSIVEAAFILLLLYALNKILAAVTDYNMPVDPIEMEDDFDD